MAKAKASPAIEIGVEDWHMLHEDRTIERARGYEELKKLYIGDGPDSDDPRQPVDFDGQLKRLKPVSNAAEQASSSKTLSSRSASAALTSTSRDASREKSRSNTPGSASSTPGPSHRPVKPLPKRIMRRLASSPVPDSEEEKEEHAKGSRTPPLPAMTVGGRKRKALEKKWAETMHGAAPVTFVNDINHEEIPNLVSDFQYLERHYV